MKSHDKIMMPKSRLEIFVDDADFITPVRGTGRARERERELATQLKLHNHSRYFLKFLLARWLVGLRGVYNNYYLIFF